MLEFTMRYDNKLLSIIFSYQKKIKLIIAFNDGNQNAFLNYYNNIVLK